MKADIIVVIFDLVVDVLVGRRRHCWCLPHQKSCRRIVGVVVAIVAGVVVVLTAHKVDPAS